MFVDAIMGVVNDPAARDRIITRARAILPWSGARCATTQSLVYHAAKGRDVRRLTLHDVWVGTDVLADMLESHGWRRASMDQLKPGMICFSKDLGGRRGAPDHTYTFVRWHDRAAGVAMIFDNTSKRITQRNLGPGPRTPFDYALYPPI